MKNLDITKKEIKELEMQVKIIIEDFIKSNGDCNLKIDIDNVYGYIEETLTYLGTDVKISITI